MDLMQMRRRLLMQSVGGLPKEYQQVEWIQSNGGAYIDTGYVPTRSTSAKIEYEWTSSPGTASLFGVGSGSNLLAHLRYGKRWYCYANGVIWLWNSGGAITTIGGYTPNVHYHLSLIGTTFTINNNSVEGKNTFDSTTISTSLFGAKTATGVSDIPSILKVFAFQLFENGKLSLNFIPCYRKSDGEIGMYDTVSKAFYTNAGTGTFLKGADI